MQIHFFRLDLWIWLIYCFIKEHFHILSRMRRMRTEKRTKYVFEMHLIQCNNDSNNSQKNDVQNVGLIWCPMDLLWKKSMKKEHSIFINFKYVEIRRREETVSRERKRRRNVASLIDEVDRNFKGKWQDRRDLSSNEST